MPNHVPRHIQPCRACGAIIVDIVDGDLRHAELIEDSLAAGRVAEAVAGDALIDIVIVDLGVKKSFDAGFEPKLGVVDFNIEIRKAEGYGGSRLTFASGFDELGQTYA